MIYHLSGHATIDTYVLTRDETSLVRAEKKHHISYIQWIANTSCRLLNGIGTFIDGVGCVNPSRRNAVYTNLSSKTDSQSVSQSRYATFCCSIAFRLWLTHTVTRGRYIDDGIIRQETPAYFRYSIDECFMYLDGIELDKLQTWGENLHKRVKREVGLPISIGLAPNKTLAKIASKLAKKYAAYKHCCMIDTDYKREKALEWCPIEDVWGIGRRYAAKLQALGCKTAFDFAKHHKDWVRLTFNNINIVRTWQELNGEDAVPNEVLELCSLATNGTQELAKKKSICTSRSFNGMIRV